MRSSEIIIRTLWLWSWKKWVKISNVEIVFSSKNSSGIFFMLEHIEISRAINQEQQGYSMTTFWKYYTSFTGIRKFSSFKLLELSWNGKMGGIERICAGSLVRNIIIIARSNSYRISSVKSSSNDKHFGSDDEWLKHVYAYHLNNVLMMNDVSLQISFQITINLITINSMEQIPRMCERASIRPTYRRKFSEL